MKEKDFMKYVEIPYVDKPVSRILFGTAIPPYNAGGENDELLDAMLDLGINTFDSARVYGKAEDALGKWIEKRGNRKDVVILTKGAHFNQITQKDRVNPKAMRKDLGISLGKLRTDYIDIYLLHRDDVTQEVGPIVETFNEMHAEGKIGAFGGSNWTHERIEAANEYAYAHNLIPFTVSSPNFGLAAQLADLWGHNAVSIAGADGAEAREWYRKNQMPVVAYSSLGRGFFSGKMKSADSDRMGEFLDEYALKGYGYPENFERLRRAEILAEKHQVTVPQIAMAYLFGQNINALAIVSTSKAERMQQNIAALDIELTAEECRYLNLEAESC